MGMNSRLCTLFCLMLITATGCLFFEKPRPWKPGQYTLKEIEREYSKGTYKETFRNLPYEEKMNICMALYTQVRPALIGIVDIFEGADHETADRVMKEIIEDANVDDDFIVCMKVSIWEVIARHRLEEYYEDRNEILNILKQHEQTENTYWGICIAILGGFK